MRIDRRRPDILVADDLLDTAELIALRSFASQVQFERQDLGPARMRSRARAVLDEPAIGSMLWNALMPYLGRPSEWFSDYRSGSPTEEWTFSGCNPRTRFYSYSLGGDFAPHEDESWQPNESTKSVLTLLLYLGADECLGGETVIDGENIEVRPGRIAVFDHRLRHAGLAVEKGSKLVLRNDVIITRRLIEK